MLTNFATATAFTTDTLDLPPALDWTPYLDKIEYNGNTVSTNIGQVVVRDDTDDVLGIVKSRYAPQSYASLWDALVAGLHESGLDLSEVEVSWRIMNNGAKAFAEITLKKYNYDRIVGEKTTLALRVYNSVDGSLRYVVTAMIKILSCANGQQSISSRTSAAFKHTRFTDPVSIGKTAATWPVALEDDAHLFNHMKTITMDRDTAQVFLTDNFCKYKTKSKVKINEKHLNHMMSLYDTYRASIGDNTYALYNALTHYGTHVDQERSRGADFGNRALFQEKAVQTLVQGPAFRSLVQYDEFKQRLAA